MMAIDKNLVTLMSVDSSVMMLNLLSVVCSKVTFEMRVQHVLQQCFAFGALHAVAPCSDTGRECLLDHIR